MIACQLLGLTSKASEMLTKILHGTEYILKIGRGQAKKTHGTTNIYRILGIGQGSGGPYMIKKNCRSLCTHTK